MTLKGKHLYGADGVRIGEVKDMVGLDGNAPLWVTVKMGMFTQRMVPFEMIDESGDQLRTDLTADDVKSAPKVPVHIEPVGDDLTALRRHYGTDST